ncbi:hypothetical protein HYS00_02440 [Candidatus Microgenomates bacterium]|nr:hypothetical protein [Candidatus Microgenomates bacterium]
MKFTHKVARLPKETVEITTTIPWTVIKEAYDKAFTALSEALEVEGFRRGKAPKAVAEKHIPQERIYDRAIRDVLPDIYEEIVKVESLKPVVNPKIDLKEAKPDADWVIVFTVAERPKVTVGDYRKIVQEAKKGRKSADIWVPGQDAPQQPTEQEKAAQQQELMNTVLNELLTSATIEVADVIIEEELNQRLARLVDDVQKLGMTVDSYLRSKQTTMDELKASYSKEIEETHKIELILNEIASAENIEVTEEELGALFKGVKDDAEREAVQKNAYFYAMILRKQKTLDFLLGL